MLLLVALLLKSQWIFSSSRSVKRAGNECEKKKKKNEQQKEKERKKIHRKKEKWNALNCPVCHSMPFSDKMKIERFKREQIFLK